MPTPAHSALLIWAEGVTHRQQFEIQMFSAVSRAVMDSPAPLALSPENLAAFGLAILPFPAPMDARLSRLGKVR